MVGTEDVSGEHVEWHAPLLGVLHPGSSLLERERIKGVMACLGVPAAAQSSLCLAGLRRDNLLFVPPSGFWADDDWYDLQMGRRLPLCNDCLRSSDWKM